jgi:hypothetical protein
MPCLDCGSFKVESNGRCGTCNRLARKLEKKAAEPKKNQGFIKPMSDKMSALIVIYLAQKAPWIQGKMCAVFPEERAVDVHHRMGRIGFADEWARQNEIILLLDKRFWLPVSRRGHREIEENPNWAKKKGFSVDRLI